MRRALLVLVAALAVTAAAIPSIRAFLPPTALIGAGSGSPDAHGAQPAAPAASGAPAAAAFVPGPNAARVALTVMPAQKLTQGYALGVHLSSPDGKPVNETAVTFYETVDLLGPREMLIGTTATDAQGDASFLYLPARLGAHEIVVRAAGKGTVTPGIGRFTFDAQVAAAPYRSAPVPMAAFAALLPPVFGAVVLAVWLLIAFALISAARGVHGGARDHAQKKGELA